LKAVMERFCSPVMVGWWKRIISYYGQRAQGRRNKLKLCESLSLGEKRVLVVVECDRVRYLVGSTATNITLLSRLPDATQEPNSGPNIESVPCVQ